MRQQKPLPSGAVHQLKSPETSHAAHRSRFFCLVAVVSLVLIAFAVRAISLDTQSLWRDEVDAMRFATAPLEEVLSNFTRPGWNGPFYFLVLRGWIALTGTSEYAMRFLSLSFGALSVPLTYVLGRRLFNPQTGFFAALLVSVSPYLAWYSQEVKMYTLASFLALLAIYALRRAIEGDGWYWWAVQVVATSLALYTHILAALLIPVQVLIYFTWWPEARGQWLGALVSLACFTLPYLPLAGWQMPLLFQDGAKEVFQSPDQVVPTLLASWRAGNLLLLRSRVTGFGHFGLGEMALILLNGWSMGYFGSFGLGWPEGAALMGGLVVWGVLSLFLSTHSRRAELRKRFSLLCWLAVPVLAVWYISLWQPLFTDRYLIWSGLAFDLLIAVGLAVLWRSGKWGQGVALLSVALVLVFNGINLWQQVTVPGKADYRGAVGYVAERYSVSDSEGQTVQSPAVCEGCAYDIYLPIVMSRSGEFDELIVFQIPYAKYSFSYYFPHEGYPWADGLYTNHLYSDGSYMMSEAQAAEEMERMTEGYRVVWLIATEAEMWDGRGLVKSWLDANLRLTDNTEGEYLWVDVYRYEK
ncbi:MAG: glycosyltransferase family 39 protein [Anaerolineae bacterium]|nr:glycosyltransferase family 39 protein [Anaerolineae bacterium]